MGLQIPTVSFRPSPRGIQLEVRARCRGTSTIEMFTPCDVQFGNIWGYPKHGDLGCHVILDNLHIARWLCESFSLDMSAACPRVKNGYG